MRVTLSALMQDVQTLMRLGVPLTRARSFWMFGSHRRLIRLCENVTDLPNQGFFPQMSHTAAIGRRGYQRPEAPQAGAIFARPASSELWDSTPTTLSTCVPFAS